MASRDTHTIEGARIEDVEAIASIHQHLGEACGAHDWADHKWVASYMRNTIKVVSLIEGDGHL